MRSPVMRRGLGGLAVAAVLAGAVTVAAGAAPASASASASEQVNCFGSPGTIFVPPGGGTVWGTSGVDVVAGSLVNDNIFTFEGHDRVCGQDGDDWINGGRDDD